MAKRLNDLEDILLNERWNFIFPKEDVRNTQNPILENYIKHIFKRAYQVEKEKTDIIALSADGNYMCFNLGLFTKQYERVYFYLKKEMKSDDDKSWSFMGFEKESSSNLFVFDELPQRITFFSSIEDLVFDINCPLRINSAHILSDPANVSRLPIELQSAPNLLTLFNGAVEIAKKKVEANYKVAVPQYYNGQIQFLLPLSLSKDIEAVDVVMAVSKNGKFYRGNTCLTLDMAYNNARLIAKPDTPWILTATGE